MSIPQAAEEKVSYTQFLTELANRFDEIAWGPAYADGTRVFAKRGGFWRAFVISDLTASPISFSRISAGLAAGTGNYELPASSSFVTPAGTGSSVGTYEFRKNSTTLRNAMRYGSTPEVITLGDNNTALLLNGTFLSDNSIPNRDFVVDNETNVATAGAGKLRRNDSAFCFQGSLSDNGNTQRFKSFCQLWENGVISGDGVTKSFAVVFTNAMKDASYFVNFEYDDAGIDNPNNESIAAATKLNTGFTVDFGSIAPGAFDTISWYAVRYGT